MYNENRFISKKGSGFIDAYSRNMGILTVEELKIIRHSNVLVVGVGGLGGFIASSLVRLGVENITIIDSDVFDISNLNRQIFSTMSTIDKSKVEVVKKGLLDINPDLNIKSFHRRYNEDIDYSIYENISIVIDAVDNIETKLLLETDCTKMNLPLIHGAIGGWYGQLGIVMPKSNIIHEIYEDISKGIEETLMSPTFTPGIIGNLMISEFVKFLLHKDALVNKILHVDILNHVYQIIYKK